MRAGLFAGTRFGVSWAGGAGSAKLCDICVEESIHSRIVLHLWNARGLELGVVE